MEIITTEIKKRDLQQKITAGSINQLLYKYRNADDEYTEKIFTEHAMWFAHPKSFNDPFDCWANIQSVDNNGLYSMLAQRRRYGVFTGNLVKQGMNKFTKEGLKHIVDSVFNQIGICCFSKTNNNILMWSHYAHYHQGFCLEFDVLQDYDFFGFTIPTDYVDVMPEYKVTTDIFTMIEKIIKPKSIQWKYEEEVRVLKIPSEIENNGNQAFHFNPNALRKIIFGCKAHKSTIDKYKNLCIKNGFKHVKFTQMCQKKNGSFELEEKSI